jgi:hypothetical protein
MGQKYAAYDSTGAIVGFYDSIDSPVPDGVSAIKITDAQWQACFNNQGAFVVVNNAIAAAPPPDPTILLVATQAIVKQAVRDWRDALLLLTPFSGKFVQSDLTSKIQIMNIVNLGSLPPYATYWRTNDNSYMVMTFEIFVSLMATIMNREGAAYGVSALMQDAIDKLTTTDAVNAFDINVGWPL